MVSIMVSACLLGENCKYSGGNNYSESLCEWLKLEENRVKVIRVCPEVMGGLETPRPPAEILGGMERRVFNREGAEVTAQFMEGAKKSLGLAQSHGCQYAVLKERSPSCGSSYIYDGTFSGTVIEGAGLTASLFMGQGVEVFSENNFEELKKIFGPGRA